jgi:hypothetical protein
MMPCQSSEALEQITECGTASGGARSGPEAETVRVWVCIALVFHMLWSNINVRTAMDTPSMTVVCCVYNLTGFHDSFSVLLHTKRQAVESKRRAMDPGMRQNAKVLEKAR